MFIILQFNDYQTIIITGKRIGPQRGNARPMVTSRRGFLVTFAEVLPDYVRFTVSNNSAFQDIVELLGVRFESVGRGRYMYKNSMSALGNAVQVFWESVVGDRAGLCVQISGEGCRLIELDPSFPGWRKWLAMWKAKFGVRYTRIDFAIDDRDGNIPFEYVEGAVRAGDICSRHRQFKYDEKFTRKGRPARTMYVGGRSSECMLRCYEKGAQIGDEKPWLRFEYEWKGRKADDFVMVFIKEGYQAAVNLCRGEVDFLDPFDTDSVRSRRERAPWWIRLVEGARETLTKCRQIVTTFEKRVKWLEDQVASTLHVMHETQGGDMGWVARLFEVGSRKLNDRCKALLDIGKTRVFSDDFRSCVAVT